MDKLEYASKLLAEAPRGCNGKYEGSQLGTTVDQIEFLCDKFGWELMDSGVVIKSEDPLVFLMSDVRTPYGMQLFAIHAMCETTRQFGFVCSLRSSWDSSDSYACCDGHDVDHDNTPLGLATAVIEALYLALGGED